jgi:drug/metabolite transporter (DMT)-like permease
MKPAQFAVLLALGCTWGASFLFIKVLVDDIDPVLIVAGRIVFGALVLLAIVAARRLPLPRSRKTYGWLFFMGSIGSTLPFFLITWSEEDIGSGTAAVLNSTVPLFTAVLSIWFLRDEYLSPAKILGLLAGLAGVTILSGGDLLDLGRDALIGDLAVVAASLAYGCAAIVARRHLRGEDPIALGAVQLSFAFLVITPVTLALEPPSAAGRLEADEWAAWLALGLGGTGLAYCAYYWLIDQVGALRATTVTYIIPPVGLFLGWAVLDESISWTALAGLALIVAGIALVNEVVGSSALRRKLEPSFGIRHAAAHPGAPPVPPSAD